MPSSASVSCRLAMSTLSGVSERRRRGARNTKRRRFVTARYCRDRRRNGSGARRPHSCARARLQARTNSPRRSDGCVAALICSRTLWRSTVPLPCPAIPDHPALTSQATAGRHLVHATRWKGPLPCAPRPAVHTPCPPVSPRSLRRTASRARTSAHRAHTPKVARQVPPGAPNSVRLASRGPRVRRDRAQYGPGNATRARVPRARRPRGGVDRC